MHDHKYDTLVLSGGGVKGISLLGTLYCIYEREKHSHINTIVGTSVGAIIGYLLIIGYTPIELLSYICRTDLELSEPNILSMLKGDGAFDYELLLGTHLEHLTVTKVGFHLTMRELWTIYHKKLVCVTYNMSKARTEYIDYTTHPNVPCLLALRMSSNIPGVFARCRVYNQTYVDGGLTSHFPIRYVDRGDNRVLGICTDCHVAPYSTFDNIMVEALHIMTIQACIIADHEVNHVSERCDVIRVSSDISPTQFNPKTSDKMNLFSNGYQSGLSYYDPQRSNMLHQMGDLLLNPQLHPTSSEDELSSFTTTHPPSEPTTTTAVPFPTATNSNTTTEKYYGENERSISTSNPPPYLPPSIQHLPPSIHLSSSSSPIDPIVPSLSFPHNIQLPDNISLPSSHTHTPNSSSDEFLPVSPILIIHPMAPFCQQSKFKISRFPPPHPPPITSPPPPPITTPPPPPITTPPPPPITTPPPPPINTTDLPTRHHRHHSPLLENKKNNYYHHQLDLIASSSQSSTTCLVTVEGGDDDNIPPSPPTSLSLLPGSLLPSLEQRYSIAETIDSLHPLPAIIQSSTDDDNNYIDN